MGLSLAATVTGRRSADANVPGRTLLSCYGGSVLRGLWLAVPAATDIAANYSPAAGRST
jgi:hypothetical protein